MKSHFIRLFNYDHFANVQMMDMILKQPINSKPSKLMAHLLAARQIWLKRCMGLPAAGIELWPDSPPGSLMPVLENSHTDWLIYLNSLQDTGFDHYIKYVNTRGEHFVNNLSDILAHIINHGTHHRAQIGQHLKFTGVSNLPASDYIYYLREVNP